MVVKSMVPFWFPMIIRHRIVRVSKKGFMILATTPTHMGTSVGFGLRVLGLRVGVQGLGFGF